MSEFRCSWPLCLDPIPHEHGIVHSPTGATADAIIYTAADPNAEIRDPDTGEVIFPATKAPFTLIEGGLSLDKGDGA